MNVRDWLCTWDTFHEVDKCLFETFVATVDDEMVASLGVWGYNGYISELGSFQSNKNVNEHLFGTDAVKWEVIRWGSQQGFREFDLTGTVENATPKELAIRQFKEKWGGDVRPYLVVWRKN